MLKKQVPGSPDAQAWGAASAFFVFFFTGIFASTWLDVPFTYPTETFPLEVRARGNAFGTVGWGLGCGTVSLLVPVWFACTLPSSTFSLPQRNVLMTPYSDFTIHLPHPWSRQFPYYPRRLGPLP